MQCILTLKAHPWKGMPEQMPNKDMSCDEILMGHVSLQNCYVLLAMSTYFLKNLCLLAGGCPLNVKPNSYNNEKFIAACMEERICLSDI